MITKWKKGTFLLAAVMLGAVCAVGYSANANISASAEEATVIESAVPEAAPSSVNGGVSLLSCGTIVVPTVTPCTNGQYYCAAVYNVTQNDVHGTKLQFYGYPNSQYPEYTVNLEAGQSMNYVVMSKTTTNLVAPPCPYICARCPDCGTRSEFNGQLFYNANMRSSKFTVVDYKVSGNIPTSYDQNGSYWTHGGSSGNYIAFTIACKGDVTNGYVKIPALGTNSSETFTLGGIRFTVRTGPNKVSIKASETVACDMLNTMFGFTVTSYDNLFNS